MARDANGFDDAVWRKLRSTVQGLGQQAVYVGIVGPAAGQPHAGSSLTNAEIGAIHEFGAPEAGIVARPFVKSTFSSRRAELVQLQATAATAIVERGMPVEKALGLIGAWAAGAVRDQIQKYGAFIFQPLALRTVLAKGHDLPLLDTGQMVRSVSFMVFRAV